MERDERVGSLAPILDNEGFRRIAAAIRRATVTEQYRNEQALREHRRRDPEYEIRYGLLQDLRRKAEPKEDFLTALADFIRLYDEESVRKAEQYAQAGRDLKYRRSRVTTRELEQVVRLFDRYSPPMVAMLLLAYATARESRDVGPELGAENAADVTETEGAPSETVEQSADEPAE